MRLISQVIAPKTRRFERTFEKFLLFTLTLFLIASLSISLLLGYGMRLLLSEPEPASRTQDQRSENELKIRGAQFELCLNEKTLSIFPPFFEKSESTPNLIQKRRLALLQTQWPWPTQFSITPEIQNQEDYRFKTILLRDLKVKLKKDTVLMTVPVTFRGNKKTITVEESLRVQDGALVANIKAIQIGRLPIPGFIAIPLLDSFAPYLISSIAHETGLTTFTDFKKLQLSKMIMPPLLLILFGPKDRVIGMFEKGGKEKIILESLPTAEVSSVRIDENKIMLEGSATALTKLPHSTISVLKMKLKDLGR